MPARNHAIGLLGALLLLGAAGSVAGAPAPGAYAAPRAPLQGTPTPTSTPQAEEADRMIARGHGQLLSLVCRPFCR